jgi:hypothetical protein
MNGLTWGSYVFSLLNRRHDVADQRMASVHTVSFEYSDDDRNPTTYIIGVYGSPYQSSQPYPTSYDIVGMNDATSK